MKNIFFFLLVSCIFTACTPKSKSYQVDEKTEIADTIFVTYFCGIIKTEVAIRCERMAEIQSMHPQNNYNIPIQLVDTFIVDKIVIDSIKSKLMYRESIPDFEEDARMYISIISKDGSKDEICLHAYSLQAKYNGVSCMLSQDVVFLLKKEIGYYNWIDISGLNMLDELKYQPYYDYVKKQITENDFMKNIKENWDKVESYPTQKANES